MESRVWSWSRKEGAISYQLTAVSYWLLANSSGVYYRCYASKAFDYSWAAFTYTRIIELSFPPKEVIFRPLLAGTVGTLATRLEITASGMGFLCSGP